MKRIRVPEGIKIVVQDSIMEFWRRNGEEILLPRDILLLVNVACESFAKAFSEHPQVPTDEQLEEMDKALYPSFDAHKEGIWDGRREYIREWQRRMFLEPESEVMEEIKDLTIPNQVSNKCFMHPETYNERILEAYRRGLRKRGE